MAPIDGKKLTAYNVVEKWTLWIMINKKLNGALRSVLFLFICLYIYGSSGWFFHYFLIEYSNYVDLYQGFPLSLSVAELIISGFVTFLFWVFIVRRIPGGISILVTGFFICIIITYINWYLIIGLHVLSFSFLFYRVIPYLCGGFFPYLLMVFVCGRAAR